MHVPYYRLHGQLREVEGALSYCVFLVSSDCWMMLGDGNRITAHGPLETVWLPQCKVMGHLSLTTFWCGCWFWGDVLSTNSSGWTESPVLQVLRLDLTNLAVHEYSSSISISHQNLLVCEGSAPFKSVETGWLTRQPPNFQEHKRWLTTPIFPANQ